MNGMIKRVDSRTRVVVPNIEDYINDPNIHFLSQKEMNELFKNYDENKVKVIHPSWKLAPIFEDEEETNLSENDKITLETFCRHINNETRDFITKNKKNIDLLKHFELCKAAVLSVDIRNSTFLMEHCKDEKEFANFINAITYEFKNIVYNNFGVYDKFTGDGFICYFPEFLSGPDFAYYALKTAKDCHAVFNQLFTTKENLFDLLMTEKGLGIGIDVCDISIRMITDDITIIGKPVVHACRLNGAPGGKTYINNQAYNYLKEKYEKYIDFEEKSFEYKHVGNILAREFKFKKAKDGSVIMPEQPNFKNLLNKKRNE